MRKKTLIISFLAIIASSFVCSFSNAQIIRNIPTVYLKSKGEIVIDSDKILLSDLFYSDINFEDKVVRNAPLPGKKLKLFRKDLRRIIKSSQLHWPGSIRKALLVSRASKQIPIDIIRKAVIEALETKHINDEVDIEFNNPNLKILIPKNASIKINIVQSHFDQRTGRFEVVLKTTSAYTADQNINLRGKAFAIIPMPVPNRHIGAGQLIRKENITWKKFRIKQHSFGIISSLDQLLDQVAKRPLTAGRLIRNTDIHPQQLVKKGEFVTLHFKNKSMSLSTRGISTEQGARNQIIRVQNSRSKRIVEARVLGPNIALVLPITRLLK